MAEVKRNQEIRHRIVLVIDEQGEKIGEMPTYLAIAKASESGLDLVEVSATANPPVCKIMDFGKFKYEQTRKKKESKASSAKQPDIKTLRLRPNIGIGDLEVKINHINRFLLEGDKVQIDVQFKGREISHKELALGVLKKIMESVSSSVIIEAEPRMEGRMMSMRLAPGK